MGARCPCLSHFYNLIFSFLGCQPFFSVFLIFFLKGTGDTGIEEVAIGLSTMLPDFDGFVLTGANEGLSIGGKGDGVYRLGVTCESTQELS